MFDSSSPRLTRRSFLRHAGALGALSTFLPGRILADPYHPWQAPLILRRPVRVRGAVRAGGRGVAGVAVSDGLRVVDTDRDGRFDFVSDSGRSHVFMSVPSGYRIPVNPTGTARFYRPMAPGPRDEMTATFDLERLAGSDENHATIVLADIQTRDEAEMALFHGQTVPDLEETIRGLGDTEILAIACGDIVNDELSLFPRYEQAVQRLGIPAFQVVGNHDLDFDGPTDDSSTRTFRDHFGPPYYSFNRGRVHYVVLDDVFWHSAGYVGYLDQDQLDWLEADLARVEPGMPVVISLHIPVEGTRNIRQGAARPTLGGSVANRDFLYRMVERFPTHFLSGHTHDQEHVFEQGTHGHICGTVCGAWWNGPIAGDGTPNGYAVYEARGEEIRWRYKSTGHTADHQLRTYARGSVPEAPDEVAANVWNWDPSWVVELHDGSDRRGAMAGRVAVDPLAMEFYGGPDIPAGRGWVDPYPTRHMFFAPVPEGAGELTVRVVDRFGRSYSAPVLAAGVDR